MSYEKSSELEARTVSVEGLLRHFGNDFDGAARFIMSRFDSSLRSIALWHVGDHELVRDIVAETYSRFFSRIHREDLHRSLPIAVMLRQTCKGICIDKLRRRNRGVFEVLTDTIPDTAVEEWCDTTDQNRLRVDLRRCIDELSEPKKSLTFGYYFQERSLRNLASECGKSQEWVRQQIIRAYPRLKCCLEDCGWDKEALPDFYE